MADRRPRILVLNQYYKPGVEATANLLADLCESLTEEFEVTVVTGRLQGRPELPSRELLERSAGAPNPLDRVRPRRSCASVP